MEIIKKQITFRGKKIEELKELGVREFAKYLRARERRGVLRQFQVIEDFVSRSKKKLSKNKQIKTHQRDIIIVPNLIGMKIHVYNGKSFIPVDITEEMLGHRLGEFSLTREKIKHGTAGVGATKGSKSKSKK
ncbi:MAG: ribosomal protein S19 family protein [Nanoarchaeota archaeon]